MIKLKVGDYVGITYTEDNDIAYWLEEQEKKGITKFKVIEIDKEGQMFWLENCPYAIWINEDEYNKEVL